MSHRESLLCAPASSLGCACLQLYFMRALCRDELFCGRITSNMQFVVCERIRFTNFFSECAAVGAVQSVRATARPNSWSGACVHVPCAPSAVARPHACGARYAVTRTRTRNAIHTKLQMHAAQRSSLWCGVTKKNAGLPRHCCIICSLACRSMYIVSPEQPPTRSRAGAL